MTNPLRTTEIQWLLKQVRPMRPLYVTVFIAAAATSLLSLCDPLVIKWLVDDVLPQRQTVLLIEGAFLFIGIYVFSLILSGLTSALNHYAQIRVVFNTRMKLFRHLQALTSEFYTSSSVGDLLYRVEEDVRRTNELGGEINVSMVRIVVNTILTVVIMAILSIKLTLIVVTLLAVLVLVRQKLQPRLKRLSDEAQASVGKRSGFLQEHLAGMTQIQLLQRQKAGERQFFRLSRELVITHVVRQYTEATARFLSILMLAIAAAAVLGYGGLQVIRGTLTVGGFIAFYAYVARLFEPIDNIVMLYSQFQRSTASIRRVMETFAIKPTIVEAPKAVTIPPSAAGTVVLSDVWFSYRGRKPVLRGLNLTVEKGEIVSIVGASGCGKTTIAQLLARLYDANRGNVLVGGVEVREAKLRSLRSFVAYAPQDPLLFNVSLAENLRYGNPRATQQDLDEVAQITQLERVLARLPGGWSGEVGPRGSRLSGGERQRVAIARALLQRPRILILDETTSALDAATERNVFDNLRPVLAGVTTILIAHRLSAILFADRIICLAGGKVVESGRHDQLYGLDGEYRRLCEQQFERGGTIIDAPAEAEEMKAVES